MSRSSPRDTQSTAKPKPPRWKVDDLLKGATEAILEHNEDEYRLRVTSAGKLILTK